MRKALVGLALLLVAVAAFAAGRTVRELDTVAMDGGRITVGVVEDGMSKFILLYVADDNAINRVSLQPHPKQIRQLQAALDQAIEAVESVPAAK